MKKNLNCIHFFASIFVVLLTFSGCDSGNSDDLNEDWVCPEDTFQEGEDAFAAVFNMRSGVNLGNGFDSNSFDEEEFAKGNDGWIVSYGNGNPNSWETAWGQPVTSKKLIKGIKALGFNAVRVPVTWAEHIDFETGEIDAAWLERVQEVVDWVLEEDMYCLLNTHHDGGECGWVRASSEYYTKYKDLYQKLYTNIGKAFKDYSDRLILCGTNEMISDSNWGDGLEEQIEAVNKWNQLFVTTIRSTGGKNAARNLMVGTYCCSTSEGNLQGFEKPIDTASGNKLILEVHIYSPKEFVWEKADWLPNWTTKWSSSFESSLKGEFNLVKNYADSYNMPVVIGEWGTLSRRFPGDNNWKATTDEEGEKFTSYFIKESRNRGFTSFYWDTQEILDRKTGEATSPKMINGIRENY